MPLRSRTCVRVCLWSDMECEDANARTRSFLNVKTMHVMALFSTYSPLNPETRHGSSMQLETRICSAGVCACWCVCVHVRHCQAKMLYHSSALQLFGMRDESPAPRLWVWNPIFDPNAALVEPWCHPSTLRPGGLVFKWILLISLIRGWKSQLNSMWWSRTESGADGITALGKTAVGRCGARTKSPKRPALERETEVQKQFSQPLT